ncbi:MAG: hypothetical protein IJ223_07450 [Clostridia bacterium]|nr:hypothetical protein [Clostridia bacterium]
MSKTRKINDTFYIVDLGYRNEQPVALVEKTFADNSKEYIIAFDYSIKDDNIDWGYGYYYNENIDKAKEDFSRVLKGDNLADTFSEKETSEDEFNLSFYSEDEIKDLIKSNAELYYVDDGIDEAIIKFEDIPDFIVEYNRKLGMRDLKFFRVGKGTFEPDITTFGEFLNKISPELRERLIERLGALQTNEIEPKKFKIIDEEIYSYVESKLEQQQEKKVKDKKKNKEAR